MTTIAPVPSIGDLVHYAGNTDHCCPAIVSFVHADGSPALAVIIAGQPTFKCESIVNYSVDGLIDPARKVVGTWHRVEDHHAGDVDPIDDAYAVGLTESDNG